MREICQRKKKKNGNKKVKIRIKGEMKDKRKKMH